MDKKGDVKKTMTLASKLARIGKEIGVVKKSGRNSQQNYDFIEYGVVAGRIRELFDEYSVVCIPSVADYQTDEVTNKYGNQGYHYTIKMEFTLVNGEDPEDRFTANWLGEAIDYGDKSINKAETAGTKYFLMRLFNISEKGEKEADHESPEPITQTREIPREAPKGRKLDFGAVRKHVANIDTVEELNAYWHDLHLTETQAAFLKKAFADRKAEIGG